MSVFDKLKNALFEVEYVEVDEPPKKEKKSRFGKNKEKEKNEPEKSIAKKIVLPGRREEKIDELHEEELTDEDFEIRPKDEVVKRSRREEFKLLDEDDFKVEDTVEPEIITPPVKESIFEEPIKQEELITKNEVEEVYNHPSPQPVERHVEYHVEKESKPYGMDNSYNVPVHQYGTYERKDERVYFKPSPIISPIYGILDKNYKKEDVREKKEVRLSSYSRGNVSVDDVRNKAYGKEKEEVLEDTKFEVEEDNNNLLVDLSDKSKPEVKEITMGDAMEYFQDLGLEYNVDYVDATKEKATGRRVKEEKEEPIKEEVVQKKVEEVKPVEDIKVSKIVDIKDESNTKEKEEDNDNLFDLIDSMYQENE